MIDIVPVKNLCAVFEQAALWEDTTLKLSRIPA